MISFKSVLKELYRCNAWLACLGAFLVSIHLAAPAYSIVLEKKDLQGASQKGDSTVAKYVPGEVLVKFKKGVSKVDKKKYHSDVKAEVISEIPDIDVEKVKSKIGESTEALIEKYRKNPHVEYAEANGYFYVQIIPNDPRFTELWGLHNSGQTGGTIDADIDIPGAWHVQTGSSDVIVADIDTGVDYNHEDLAANMWTNPGEIAGNGIDDDGNGYIDDVHGWDFANNDNDPMDDFGHGTHTAGTIAAVGNNGVGIVGVNWRARIMPLKFMDVSGSGTFEAAASAIIYAANMGARLSSNSWGCGPSAACFSQTTEDAIAYANSRGMLFVAAAGNDANDNDATITYPCTSEQPNVLCVAATDHNDQKAYFSNYGGRTVDMAAPGVDILSTVPTGSCYLCDSSGYKSLSGTSMATPHVAGAAALLLAQSPSFTTSEIITTLLNNVDGIPALAGLTVTGGRLNVDKALRPGYTANTDLVMTAISGPTSAVTGGNITISDTVLNQGTGSTGGFYVGLYLSTDAAITEGDILIGKRWVSDLASGVNSSAATAITVPNNVAAGVYYLGAIADFYAEIPETDEGNNALAGNTIAIAIGPDVVTTSVSGPTSAVTGGNITISDTVLNQGTGSTGGFYVGWYLSADDAITAGDILIGRQWVNSLAAGTGINATTTFTIPASIYDLRVLCSWCYDGRIPPGAYYLGAIADYTNQVPESNENNNALAGNTIVISLGPDVAMTAVSGPASVATGGNITVSDTVVNQGTGSTGLFHIGWYLSADAAITTGDILLGSRSVRDLTPGASNSAATTFTFPTDIKLTPGTYYLGAIADYADWTPESDETNNALAGNTISVTIGPDLTITAVSGPSTGVTGQTISIAATVTNRGTQAVNGFQIAYFVSQQRIDTILAPGTGDGEWIDSLAPGESITVTHVVYLNELNVRTEGRYYIGAAADLMSVIVESDETNNTLTGNTIAITFGPDVVMTAVIGPASAVTNERITITDTVLNQGIGTAYMGLWIRWYLSTDARITTRDIPLSAVTQNPDRYVGPLAPGESNTATTTVTIPNKLSPGTYYLGAIADYKTNQVLESNENNNALAGNTIAITIGPDLVMTAVSGPSSAVISGNITITDTVLNQGTAPVFSSSVGLYLSTDANITTRDIHLVNRALNDLASGASSTVSTTVAIPADIAPGTYYIGAIVDDFNYVQESNEANNAKAGNVITITR